MLKESPMIITEAEKYSEETQPAVPVEVNA